MIRNTAPHTLTLQRITGFQLLALGLLTVLYFFLPSTLSASDHSLFIGTFGEYQLTGSPDEQSESSYDFGTYGFYNFRSFLENGDYVTAKASASLSGLSPERDLHDSKRLELGYNAQIGDSSLEFNTSLTSSFLPESYINPTWKTVYRMQRGREEINPSLAYRGGYVNSEGSPAHHYHEGEIGFSYSPTVELSTRTLLYTGVDLWIESGQRDEFVGLQQELNGLLGYFFTWSLTGNLDYTRSDVATTHKAAGSITGQVEWSPSRKVTLSASPLLELAYLPDSGTWNTSIEGLLRVDYVIRDGLFVYTEGATSRSHNGADGTTPWSATITGGIDLSLY
ncbi:MAG: hypothetical protein ACQEQU_09640 [Spirochaetota bacterium]